MKLNRVIKAGDTLWQKLAGKLQHERERRKLKTDGLFLIDEPKSLFSAHQARFLVRH